MSEAYIVAGKRTAVGRAKKGKLRHVRPDDMAAEVVKAVVADVPELDPTRVDDLIVGCAIPEAEQGMQIGRMIALMALPMNVSGVTVNSYCGAGLYTIAMVVAIV